MVNGRLARIEPGLSLLETVVALGLFATCVVLALSLYAGARGSIRSAHDRAGRQQARRVALDLISRDLRAAGFNVDPDGSPLRPDEPIEGAWDSAIVVRGAFAGNDEIVGYFLAKPDGSSPGTLQFDADVEPVPRDGVVETVSVSSLSVEPSQPPYTLYRFSVIAGSRQIRRRPVIDGVRALRFSYRDRAGFPVAAPGGSDDAPSRRSRDAVHRVRVEIDLAVVTTVNGSSRETMGVVEVAPRNLRGG